MKAIPVVFSCFLIASILAVPPEKQIEELFFNIIEGNNENGNMIAPDADAIIIKLLDGTYSSECNNLTEKLFIHEMTRFLVPAKKPSVYTVTTYSLEKGTLIHKRENKIKQNKINLLQVSA